MSAPPPPQPLSSAKTSYSSSSKNQPQPSSSTTLSASSITIPSDSENYDGNNEFSSSGEPSDDPSPPESAPFSPMQQQQSPVILYTPPTLWSLFRGVAINLFLPFVNGLMLGFGELFAHEVAFRLGWSGTKVSGSTCSFSVSFYY